MPRITKRIYSEITKTEKQPDGTLIVEGFASTGSKDSDGETITAEAMRKAIPDYMRFGAVREMHDAKKAAGTALEIEVQEDGRTRFVSHVVDPVAVLKVESGVYKGFSIGGSIPKGGRDPLVKSKINELNLVEVSLVDRPANPEAVITCFKAEGASEPENENDEVDDTDITSATTDEPADPVAKGLWNAQRLIEALGIISSVCGSAEFELKQGEHTEKMMAAMRDALASLGAVTQKYLGEEIVLMTPAKSQAAKALGLGEDTPWADILSKAECVTKALAEATNTDQDPEAATKEAAEVSEVAKAAGIELEEGALYSDLLKAAMVELMKVKAEVTVLKGRPAAPRARVNGAAISKSADSGELGDNQEVKPVLKDGEENEVATLIKAAHSRPIAFMGN